MKNFIGRFSYEFGDSMHLDRLFPDLEFNEWVDLWKCAYVDPDGDDDVQYIRMMNAVHSPTDINLVKAALIAFSHGRIKYTSIIGKSKLNRSTKQAGTD